MRKIIQGRCRWASVSSPDTTYEPIYSIQVEIPEDQYLDFKERGFPVIQDDDEYYMKITRKVSTQNGNNKPPRLFDSKKNEVDVLIGNGSLVRVQYREYEIENRYGVFKGFDLQAVQILNIINRSDDELLDDFLIDYTETQSLNLKLAYLSQLETFIKGLKEKA